MKLKLIVSKVLISKHIKDEVLRSSVDFGHRGKLLTVITHKRIVNSARRILSRKKHSFIHYHRSQSFNIKVFSFVSRFLIRLSRRNGTFNPRTIWWSTDRNAHHHWAFRKTLSTNTRNGTSRTMRRPAAISDASSTKWAYSMMPAASTLIIWWNNWARTVTRLKPERKSLSAPTRIPTKTTTVYGHSVDSSASKRHICHSSKPAWRKTTERALLGKPPENWINRADDVNLGKNRISNLTLYII